MALRMTIKEVGSGKYIRTGAALEDLLGAIWKVVSFDLV